MTRRDRTVMVIENDPDCLESVADVLRYAGYEVIAAADCLEALRVLAAGPAPELILLDLMLPVMDGEQFLVEQRSRPALAQIPVALLSGERDLHRRARELSVAGVIEKPVEFQVLLATVRRLLGTAD